MSSGSDVSGSTLRLRAIEAFDGYIARIRAGEDLSAEEYLRGVEPDIRDVVRDLFVELAHGGAPGDRPASELEPLGPGVRLGDFEIKRELGRGGMGIVWEAEELSLRRRVALKTLPPRHMDAARSRARFRREASAAARLRHPHVVSIFSVGEDKGYQFIAQELVGGGKSLKDWIAERNARGARPGSLELRMIAELFAKAAGGVQCANEAGIIHRDLKPGNILLATDGSPKVADFGLATIEGDPTISHTGEFLGTAAYTSPEQTASGPTAVDARSDVFSLGVTMYEALTLDRPFDGATIGETIQRIQSHEPVDPRQRNPNVDRDLAVICLKALEKSPGHRYQGAGEFAADLERYLHHEPIQARPTPLRIRALKWVRRHPVIAVSSSLSITALLVLAYLGSLFLAQRRSAVRAYQTMPALMALLDPESPVAPDREREILEDAAALAATELSTQPELRATLLSAVGGVHYQHGRLEVAAPILAQALRAWEESGQPWSERSAEIPRRLASCYAEEGRYEEVAELLRGVLHRSRAPEDAWWLGALQAQLLLAETALGDEAGLREFAQHHGDPLEFLESVLSRYQQRVGVGSLQTLELRFLIASRRALDGELVRALDELEAIQSDFPAGVSLLHSLNLKTRRLSAEVFARLGLRFEAWRERAAIALQTGLIYGETDPRTRTAELALAWATLDRPSPEDALEAFQRILDSAEPSQAGEHLDALRGVAVARARIASFPRRIAEAKAGFLESMLRIHAWELEIAGAREAIDRAEAAADRLGAVEARTTLALDRAEFYANLGRWELVPEAIEVLNRELPGGIAGAGGDASNLLQLLALARASMNDLPGALAAQREAVERSLDEASRLAAAVRLVRLARDSSDPGELEGARAAAQTFASQLDEREAPGLWELLIRSSGGARLDPSGDALGSLLRLPVPRPGTRALGEAERTALLLALEARVRAALESEDLAAALEGLDLAAAYTERQHRLERIAIARLRTQTSGR